MCGIVALLSPSPDTLADPLAAATRRLSHPGPDGAGSWISLDGCVALGHARLSIIDLETGDQPLANEDGSLQLVVNGEFYGFERIREQLTARGHLLKSRTDSEILLHLYEEQGTECLSQLRGEFAFALWDGPRRRLFAARDRVGVKPLFYARTGAGLRLASEAKALLAAGHPARWDRQAFHQSITGIAGPDACLFEGIQALPPGHFLLAEAGQVRVERYWDFDHPRADQLTAVDEASLVVELRHQIEDSIRVRLRADVPVGIYLSGGLDSNAIAGVAVRHVSGLQGYSVLFPDDAAHNEEDAIRATAARLGIQLHTLEVGSRDVADHLPAAVAQWEDLPKSEWVVGKYLLSRLVTAQGGKVVLTGEGPDEILAGHLVLARDAARAPGGAEQASGTLEAIRRQLGFVPNFLVFRAMAAQRIDPLLSPEFRGEFEGRDALLELVESFDAPGQLHGREPLSQSLYLWCKTMLPNFFMTACGDRSEMAHGVEGRVPFLDHHILELVGRLPSSLKVRGTVTKHVFREAVRPFVSEQVFSRRKKGFVTQPSRVSQTGSPIWELLQDTLRGPLLKANPFFDAGAVLAVLDDLAAGGRRGGIWDAALLNILGACLLQQAYGLD